MTQKQHCVSRPFMMNIAHKSYGQILLYPYSALSFFKTWQIVFFSIISLWIPQHHLFYFRLTNGFHVRAYTSIIVCNESRTDLHTHLTSTLPEGHNLWLDACPHAAHMVCSCNVYIPWVLYSYERGAPADSSTCQDRFVDEKYLVCCSQSKWI